MRFLRDENARQPIKQRQYSVASSKSRRTVRLHCKYLPFDKWWFYALYFITFLGGRLEVGRGEYTILDGWVVSRKKTFVSKALTYRSSFFVF